jgi:phosphoribosylformylglycinamidine synthase subunit PurL
VLDSVGREDAVKFIGLWEARRIPVLGIGVTDNSGHIEILDIANWNLCSPGAARRVALAE